MDRSILKQKVDQLKEMIQGDYVLNALEQFFTSNNALPANEGTLIVGEPRKEITGVAFVGSIKSLSKNIIRTAVLGSTAKKIIITTLSLLGVVMAQAQTKWSADLSHSKVGFSISHLVISEVEGKFDKFSASMEHSKADFTDAKIAFEADVSSINTDVEQRDNHLKSEDFFHEAKFSKIKFVGTSFKKKSSSKYVLVGDLTMRGVTKQVTLNVKYGGTIANDGYGNTKAGFIITGEVDRTEFGIAWNSKTETGSFVVGDDVSLNIKLELVKQK